jgi:hypothetical protein
MIVSKSRVNHAEYGNGIVESIDPYSGVCTVDFKGVLKRLKYTTLRKGYVNEYKPEMSALNAIEELKEKYSRNEIALIVLNELKGML